MTFLLDKDFLIPTYTLQCLHYLLYHFFSRKILFHINYVGKKILILSYGKHDNNKVNYLDFKI